MKLINKNFTIDNILGGRVKLKQLKEAYRVGIDAVLLASMVPNSKKEINILDLGSGIGSVAYCILSRIPKAKVTSIEKVEDFYNLSIENIKLNPFVKGRYTPLKGEIKDFNYLYNNFDFVVSNPPYYQEGEVRKSNNNLKSLASVESSACLIDFVNIAYKYLKVKGTLYLIQRTSRVLEVLNYIKLNKWGNITLYPLYSYKGYNAERSILSMQKLSKGKFTFTSGIIIHNSDSSYTEQAIEIILSGKSFFEDTINRRKEDVI